MTGLTKRDATDAALSVAEDIAAGRLDPAALEAELMTEMSAVLDTDSEPGSALADLQLSVCRRVLARGDMPPEEQREWLSVALSRSGSSETPPESPTLLSVDLHGE